MKQKNRIGLDTAQAATLSENLNVLLSNYQIFYINTRGFHWNIKGEKFFELHAKFEELYTDALLKIDEIAERILTLGHQPIDSFSGYLQTAVIKEATGISDGKKAIGIVVANFQILLEAEHNLLNLAAEANDEGTNALMSDYIQQQEKLVWMYSAYLS